MAKLTDILGDITQNEMSKRLMRMSEQEINAIPSHALTESINKLEEFAGRTAPRSRADVDKSPEELASINQARANAGLPLIKPKAASAPEAPAAPVDPTIVRRKSNMDIERDAAIAAAKAELSALMAQPKVKPTKTGTKTLPSQDRIAQSWSDDAGVDTAPDTRSLATRKARVSADDEQDIYAPTDADDSRSRLGLDERDTNLDKIEVLRKLIQRVAAKKAAEKAAQSPMVKEEDNKENAPKYNKDAVDKAITKSRQKIGKKEASAIHRLLKGRHEQEKK